MRAEERQHRILVLARQEGRIDVALAATRFDVACPFVSSAWAAVRCSSDQPRPDNRSM